MTTSSLARDGQTTLPARAAPSGAAPDLPTMEHMEAMETDWGFAGRGGLGRAVRAQPD
jgi:hypothetical protein